MNDTRTQTASLPIDDQTGEVIEESSWEPFPAWECRGNPGSIFEKLSQVMGEIERIPQLGEHDHLHFRYAREQDLADNVRPALATAGLGVFPSVVRDELDFRTGFGRVLLAITIGDKSGATITSFWPGYAWDKKYPQNAISKAETAAFKYFLQKTFLQSAGESDAEDPPNTVTKTINPSAASHDNPKPTISSRPPAQSSAPADPRRVELWELAKEGRKLEDAKQLVRLLLEALDAPEPKDLTEDDYRNLCEALKHGYLPPHWTDLSTKTIITLLVKRNAA